MKEKKGKGEKEKKGRKKRKKERRASNLSTILTPEPGKAGTEKENQTTVLNLESLDTGIFMRELQEGP